MPPNGKVLSKKIVLAERGFDPRTSGLWAQHASTAPLCSVDILQARRHISRATSFSVSFFIATFEVRKADAIACTMYSVIGIEKSQVKTGTLNVVSNCSRLQTVVSNSCELKWHLVNS